jgi:hypothetical protein
LGHTVAMSRNGNVIDKMAIQIFSAM